MRATMIGPVCGVNTSSGAVATQVKFPPGYYVTWSGQFEYLERAKARLQTVVPLTLFIIFILLYLNFRRFTETLIVMLSVPFALTGGLWLMYLMGFNMSVAVAVGFIVLAGHILLGLIIFGIALYFARLAAAAVRDSGVTNGRLVGTLAQIVVLTFGGAIALRQMGIADEIINLAFALLLGSVAVAAAVAFGIGGRDIARRELERFVGELREPAPLSPSSLPLRPTGPAEPSEAPPAGV